MLPRKTLVIMAKAPICGGVKTRLAREIGAVAAAAVYRHLTAGSLRGLAKDPRWKAVLAVSPDVAIGARFEAWGFARHRVNQGKGGLDRRMQRLFDRVGEGPAIIVGSDIPFVTPQIIADAFRLLGGSDAVLGPAEDGGYWLVGLRRTPRILRPFGGVRWSTEFALKDTVQNLKGRGVAFAAMLHDVDNAEDYRRFLKAACR